MSCNNNCTNLNNLYDSKFDKDGDTPSCTCTCNQSSNIVCDTSGINLSHSTGIKFGEQLGTANFDTTITANYNTNQCQQVIINKIDLSEEKQGVLPKFDRLKELEQNYAAVTSEIDRTLMLEKQAKLKELEDELYEKRKAEMELQLKNYMDVQTASHNRSIETLRNQYQECSINRILCSQKKISFQ